MIMDYLLAFGLGSFATLCAMAWRGFNYEPDEDDGFCYEEDTLEDYP